MSENTGPATLLQKAAIATVYSLSTLIFLLNTYMQANATPESDFGLLKSYMQDAQLSVKRLAQFIEGSFSTANSLSKTILIEQVETSQQVQSIIDSLRHPDLNDHQK